MKYKLSEEELLLIVKTSYSLREVLIKSGLAPKGGNYKIMKNRLRLINADCSHFDKRNWRYGKKFPLEKTKPELIFRNNSRATSYRVKQLLFEYKHKEKTCEVCGLREWLDRPIPLEVHHLDGNSHNNELQNLQILCPNCHSLTDNYRGKKLKKQIEPTGTDINTDKRKLRKVRINERKVKNRPSVDVLLSEVKQVGYCATGRKYNVSDNCIRKWIKMEEPN